MIRTSLIDFLNTGCFGPIKPGATVDEIISLLGQPKETVGELQPNSPHRPYWIYGNLEMEFNLEAATPYVDFLQIETPLFLRGKTHKLAKNLLLRLDGLSGNSRPSQFIKVVDDIDRVDVCLVDIAQYPYVTIYVDDLVMINFDYGGLEQLESLPPLSEYIKLLDIETRAIDFYSFEHRSRAERRARDETWPGQFAPFTVSGREYLKAIAL